MNHLLLADDKDRADDLIKCGEHLGILASVIEYLADSDIYDEMSPDIISGMGEIVGEYAEAVEKIANEAFPVLSKFYRDGGNKLTSRLGRELVYVHPRPQSPFDLERIDEALRKIDSTLSELKILTELRGKFLELKEVGLMQGNIPQKREECFSKKKKIA